MEFENCPLPLFLLEAGLMEVEGLVLLGPLLLLGVEVLGAVVRALRCLEPWWLRLVVTVTQTNDQFTFAIPDTAQHRNKTLKEGNFKII